MIARHTGFLLAGLVGLSACGDGARESLGMRMYDALFRGGDGSALPIETPGFTAQLIAERPQDYMIVDVPALGLNQPARIIAANGTEETWQAQGGATFAFDDGILVATRGLIDDLLVTDGQATRAALRAGGGTVQRVIESLDSQDQLSSMSFTCTITPDGPETVNLGLREVTLQKFTESCTSPGLVFENAYWLDGAADIISSRQFVSVTVAYLRSNRL